MFGLTLLWIIVLAHVVKYPAFVFGPHFAAATGTSLLEGYRRQGRWALWLYLLLTLASIFAVVAGVTIVTAGLAVALFELPISPLWVSLIILLACAAVVTVGHYRWLDRVMKLAVALLTAGTVLATVMILPRVDLSSGLFVGSGFFADTQHVFFVVALVGWMPTAIDISVWHSLWTLARRRDTGHAPTVREAVLDFHIGYVGTAALAICFVLLGAALIHGENVAIPASAAAFSNMVIGLYEQALGEWSRPIVGGSAFLVMLSTTLSVLDGVPRAFAALVMRLRSAETKGEDLDHGRAAAAFRLGLVAIIVGALVILHRFLDSLPRLIDIATTLSVLTAPFLALLNHRAIFGGAVSPDLKPGAFMRTYSIAMVLVMAAFAGMYLYVRWG